MSLLWIVASGLAMSAIVLVGGATLLLGASLLRRPVEPLAPLVLVGDGPRNLADSLAVGMSFLMGARFSASAWLVPGAGLLATLRLVDGH